MNKEDVIEAIIEKEGHYVDNPDDSGGATCWGITEQTARECGYHGDMKALPRQMAFDIYASQYWDSVRADQLMIHSPAVAEEVVDTSVNMGSRRAAIFLQRCLNNTGS